MASLIFGARGQDGSYLAEQLLAEGRKVVGVVRRSASGGTGSLSRATLAHPHFSLTEGDITDLSSVIRTLREARPTEVYNLAAQSHVGTSFGEPFHTTAVDYLGVLNVLEAVRLCPDLTRHCRVYQASSSEMFGSAWSYVNGRGFRMDVTLPLSEVFAVDQHFDCPAFQDERTPMLPNSPYAVAKLAAHHAVRLYREAYGVFACSGILFNHESPRRGSSFVTRKVTSFVGGLGRTGSPQTLRLGNLDARRDWGFAGDYTRVMALMLRQGKPSDYVVATGEAHSVRDLLDAAFGHVGLDWRDFVETDASLLRPSEVPFLRGDASKARRELNWKPLVGFQELVSEMVESDRRGCP